ncbi:hypothetical protein GIB67_042650 [Kingdonia uniflora]|uniref:Retrotransposon gag domain-containing protein n=1 Tax=Kingdonia uniflora TaxID=39325 RepID=A0A7J7P2G4_9MAGN|nr:hypothetical protein GIB67_042650 [Kingdonia uniflora]
MHSLGGQVPTGLHPNRHPPSEKLSQQFGIGSSSGIGVVSLTKGRQVSQTDVSHQFGDLGASSSPPHVVNFTGVSNKTPPQQQQFNNTPLVPPSLTGQQYVAGDGFRRELGDSYPYIDIDDGYHDSIGGLAGRRRQGGSNRGLLAHLYVRPHHPYAIQYQDDDHDFDSGVERRHPSQRQGRSTDIEALARAITEQTHDVHLTVVIVESRLSGYALTWWNSMQQSRLSAGYPYITEWSKIRWEMKEMFIPMNYSEIVFGKLQALKMGLSSIGDYTDSFYLLESRARLHETEQQRVVQLAKQASELHAQSRPQVPAPTTLVPASPIVTVPRTFVFGDDPRLVSRILDPHYLNQISETFIKLQQTLEKHGSWASAWVGESGGAYNSGGRHVSNTFVNSFWYLDQLGMASKHNTKAYCRQTLIGGNYGLLNTTTYVPNPDYYRQDILHYKRNMDFLVHFCGTGLWGKELLELIVMHHHFYVFMPIVQKEDLILIQKILVRSCSSLCLNFNFIIYWQAGITLLLINLSNQTDYKITVHNSINIYLRTGTFREGSSFMNGLKKTVSWVGRKASAERIMREEYHLTPMNGNLRSQTMYLNGNPLKLTKDGQIPTFDPILVEVNSLVFVASLSIAFITFPNFEASACI